MHIAILIVVLVASTADDVQPLDLLAWLMGGDEGGGQYPLMDFVASDIEGMDDLVQQASGVTSQLCSGEAELCPEMQQLQSIVEEMTQSPKTSSIHALGDALLHVDWFEFTKAPNAAVVFRRLQDLAAGLGGVGSGCDDRNSQPDEEYIIRVRRSLAGVETLPLESNEYKWVDFFVRNRHKGSFCPFGVASNFLFAADVLAYAVSLGGGAGNAEHYGRVRRALQIAQGLINQYLNAGRSFHELLTTRWPIWTLLESISTDLSAGSVVGASSHVTSTSISLDLHVPPEKLLYLSVIIQCRNDDYGGHMIERLNNMIRTTTWMLHSLKMPSEIILVEWNPPESTAPLVDVIGRAEGTKDSVPVRVIRVPPDVHMAIPHHKAHPIFEHIAENVAFRRARGKYFLKTNMDNILSPDVMLFLAQQRLQDDAVYRATYTEYDVIQQETEGLSPEALSEWLFSRSDLLNEVNDRLRELGQKYPEDSIVCKEGHSSELPWDVHPGNSRPFYWAGSGDFVLASRELIFKVRGYPQIAQNWQTDDLIHCRLRAVGAHQVVLQPPCVTVHQNHRRINRVRASTRWIVTDSNFDQVCANPFDPLPTEFGVGDDWGYANYDFEEMSV